MKKEITTFFTAVAVIIAVVSFFHARSYFQGSQDVLLVGFIYDEDESVPYTNNFVRSQHAIEQEFGDRIRVHAKSNISPTNAPKALEELVQEGCAIIFTTSFGYGECTKDFAQRYPHVQFCQATCANANEEPFCPNYHTFMGEIYQGRYIAGIVAGLKIKELIENGSISESQAKIGYVGAYPYAEVISGYTAFLLGARSVAPSAVMSVRYTNSWGNFSMEKAFAKQFIEEGCVIISQHSDTIGPAVACEESKAAHPVYHVGYNKSLIDIAPTTSLVSTRINWTPYIQGAVEATLSGKTIEKTVRGHVHGNDIGAGFERDWVQMLELNKISAAEGTAQKIEETIQAFRKNTITVFQGPYRGTNPFDPSDTYDLRAIYRENENASAPSFCYVLEDVISIEAQ